MARRPTSRENAGGRVVLVLLLVLALLAGGGYAAAYAASADRVPRGTTVAGVEIGGRTPAQARSVLRRQLGHRLREPVEVAVGGRSRMVTPHGAGLSVDYAATVARVGAQRSWHPARLWDYYTGGDRLDPVLEVDDAAAGRVADRLSARLGRAPVEGAVSFRRGGIDVVRPQPGEGVTADAVREAVRAAFLNGTRGPVELEVADVRPEVDAEDVQDALDSFANPAMSGPVTLVFGRSPVRLEPAQYAAAIGMRAENGRLVPTVDDRALRRLVRRGVGRAGAPVDATVRLEHGKPKVIPAKPGVRYDPEDIGAAFLRLVAKTSDDRRTKVPATVTEPGFTTREARRLRIRERVSTFTTYYPHADYRNVNIPRAAELIDGTVLKPGDVFSLNDTVGERTRRNGFTEGFIISDGIFKEDLGGGVSQVATTTFNSAFFAGLKDVEHKTHSFYIDRYPVGREATVAWGSVDLRFQNDTPYGVLITADVTPSTPASSGVVTVSMWSTKYWDITARTSDRYDFVPPQTRRLDSPDCYPNTGYGGFDLDVTRVFRRHGHDRIARTETFHTHYIPSDTVICR